MKDILILLVFLSATDVVGQSPLNRYDRLTKEEFSELKKDKNLFVPTDFRADTVIVVKYAPGRLTQLQRIARFNEFARNGEDTTGYTDEKFFGSKQVQKGQRHMEELAVELPKDLSKALEKKGVQTMIVDEVALQAKNRHFDKYWLTTVFVCEQNEPHGVWIVWRSNRIYDPRTKKFYEIFCPTNYDLIDLVD